MSTPSIFNTLTNNSNSSSKSSSSSTTQKKKRTVWKEDDELEFIDKVKEYGKNWDKILTHFHTIHHLEYIEKKDQLRMKYNDLANPEKSKFWQEQEQTELKIPNRKKLSEQQICDLESKHIAEHITKKELYAKYKQTIMEIETNEIRRGTENGDNNKAEEEIRQELDKKADERKKERQRRLDECEQRAKKEEEHRDKQDKLLESLVGHLQKAEETDKAYLQMFGVLVQSLADITANKKRKRDNIVDEVD